MYHSSKIMEKTNIRKSNIELLRIIMMFLIVAHHYVINSGLMDAFDAGIASKASINYLFLSLWGMWGKAGINVFILISGYFMCTSSLTIRRYCKVLLEWAFYHFGIYFIMLIAGYETAGPERIFNLLFEIFRYANGSGNFMSSFLIFYLFIPFINKCIESFSKTEFKKFVLLLFFVFTILSTFFFNKVIFGEVFWFIAVYCIGAYLRLYPPVWSDSSKASKRLLILSLIFTNASVVLMILVESFFNKGTPWFFMYDANRLGAVLVSIMLFVSFKNLNIGYSRAINLVAKTTFGVLLIHASSSAWREFMWVDLLHVNTFYSLPLIVLICRSILVVAGVFVFCSLIDMLRIYLIEKPVFNHFDPFEDTLKLIWRLFANICFSIYNSIVTLAER